MTERTGYILEAFGTRKQKLVAERILSFIRDASFNEHGFLPPQHDLADMLDVSSPTLRQILTTFDELGVTTNIGGRRKIAEDWLRRPGPVSVMNNTVLIVGEAFWQSYDNLGPGDLWTIKVGSINQLGYEQISGLTFSPRKLIDRRVNELIEQGIKGVITYIDTFNNYPEMKVLERFQEAGIPVAVYGYGPQVDMFDTIESDQQSGAYQLTRLLIERGCRRILRYWELRGDENPRYPDWLHQRDAGYQSAIAEAGLEPLDPLVCDAMLSWSEKEQKYTYEPTDQKTYDLRVNYMLGNLTRWISEKTGEFDAVMAISDGITFVLASACRLLSETVPIVGYDNYWYYSSLRQYEHARPLATIDKHNGLMGAKLVELLLRRVNGELESGRPCHEKVDPELIVTGISEEVQQAGR